MAYRRPSRLIHLALLLWISTRNLLAHGLDEHLTGQATGHDHASGSQLVLRTLLGLLIIGMGYAAFSLWKKRAEGKRGDTENTP